MEKEFIAHIIPTTNEVQTIEDHLGNVSNLSGIFADSFDSSAWGRAIGLLHDYGKYSEEFQHYIRSVSIGNTVERPDHSTAGGIIAKELYVNCYPILSYCIFGHHSGLPDRAEFDRRMSKYTLQELPPFKSSAPESLIPPKGINAANMHLWIRMLFSALVDADFLDTEHFMSPLQSSKRSHFSTIEELKEKLDCYITSLTNNSEKIDINIIRQSIQEQCKKAAENEYGFYSLTVPTGGGKTIASMIWAVNYALNFNKKRIIIAIPYTSIISQTASIFRNIFGQENVIEHHSNVICDNSADDSVNKLASENWDAPIIVTTNVQLFESLFSNKTSSCRKLHNLAQSIVILDEAQMLPISLLHPILDSLNNLHDLFGVAIMITTASMPAINGHIGSRNKNAFDGLTELHEIISNPEQLSKQLKRVDFTIIGNSRSDEETADSIMAQPCVLCITNTRREAANIYSNLSDHTGAYHLSRSMCPVHIMEHISLIKQALSDRKKGKTELAIRVISTQLIEAGVDLDFPIVYREIAGLDSILQAAGRCNREGSLKRGHVIVFNGEKLPPPGLIRIGSQCFKEITFNKSDVDLLSPEVIRKYFQLLYNNAESFDEAQIKELLCDDAPTATFQFETAARQFKMIDTAETSVVVAWEEGAELIKELKKKGLDREFARRLRNFSVSISNRCLDSLKSAGRIEEVNGIWIQSDPNLYDSEIGLIDNDCLDNEILIK